MFVYWRPRALPHCSTTKRLIGAPGCAAPLLPLLYWRADGRTALLLYCLPTVHCASAAIGAEGEPRGRAAAVSYICAPPYTVASQGALLSR